MPFIRTPPQGCGNTPSMRMTSRNWEAASPGLRHVRAPQPHTWRTWRKADAVEAYRGQCPPFVRLPVGVAVLLAHQQSIALRVTQQ